MHGGAGHFPQQQTAERLAGCKQAAQVGWRVLEREGTALDAVEAAGVALEDNPLFNAGTGAPLNSAGAIELDAAIMDGRTLASGAVAAVRHVKNPITLARKVLEDGRHVLLVGEGAHRFARESGMAECANEDLKIEAQCQRWQHEHGTVGCVTLDAMGRVAAGTSTGGLFNKLPGRVGDSPLIGCGTYANDVGGVSCTGIGEAIIRIVLGKIAVDFLLESVAPEEAARRAVSLLEHNARTTQ